jgi:hypothetical protein
MGDLVRRADAGWLRMIDGMVLAWVLVWLTFGVWVACALWGIASLAGTAVDAGHTLDDAGRLLQRAGDIPIIGDLPRGSATTSGGPRPTSWPAAGEAPSWGGR